MRHKGACGFLRVLQHFEQLVDLIKIARSTQSPIRLWLFKIIQTWHYAFFPTGNRSPYPQCCEFIDHVPFSVSMLMPFLQLKTVYSSKSRISTSTNLISQTRLLVFSLRPWPPTLPISGLTTSKHSSSASHPLSVLHWIQPRLSLVDGLSSRSRTAQTPPRRTAYFRRTLNAVEVVGMLGKKVTCIPWFLWLLPQAEQTSNELSFVRPRAL